MDFDKLLFFLFGVPCGLIEMYISIRNYSPSQKTPSKDRGTLIFIWLIIALSQIMTMSYIDSGYGSKIIENPTLKYSIWIPLCIIIYFMGHSLRHQAMKELGQWFTTTVRTDQNQQLIDYGWYGKIRHPSYSGILFYFLGLNLLLNNWLGLIGIMLPIYFVFLYRIYVEEQELLKHFGLKYEQYKQKVPRMLIPKIF